MCMASLSHTFSSFSNKYQWTCGKNIQSPTFAPERHIGLHTLQIFSQIYKPREHTNKNNETAYTKLFISFYTWIEAKNAHLIVKMYEAAFFYKFGSRAKGPVAFFFLCFV